MFMVKFLIIGDLHGHQPKIHFKDFDAIIAPGDFCSDQGTRKYKDQWVRSLKKNKRLSLGQYIEQHLTKKQLKKIDQDSLRVGRSILRFLNSFGKPVFLLPGNWDQSFANVEEPEHMRKISTELMRRHRLFSAKKTNPFLTKGLKHLRDCQFQSHTFGGLQILGYGLNMVPEIPVVGTSYFKRIVKKKKLTKQDWKKVLHSYEKLFGQLTRLLDDRKLPILFLSHNMPFNTKFDKIKAPGSEMHGEHYGSVIARDFILKYKPLVSVGGHMHEYFGKIRLGKTVVINAGFGAKVNTLLEINEGKITSIKFYPKPY